jgi:hypothetical protein
MSTKLDLFREAQGQVPVNPQNALQLFKRCKQEFPDEINALDALTILNFMRTSQVADLNLAYEFSEKFDDFKIRNIYSWLIFDVCVKKKELKEIQGYEKHIERACKLVHQKNLREDSTYPCPITIAILKIVDSYSDVSFNAQKVKDWLSKLNVVFLSLKTSKINSPKGEIELASDYEKYHSLMTKALFKLGEYKDCLDLSKSALSTINDFHFNNDLWFKMRVALCEEKLGNHEESERILVKLLESKEGGDKWFLYRDIAEIYFEQKENEKAWKYAVDSAFYGNEPHFLINLYLLQARILFKLQRTEKIELLANLVAAIVKEQGWRIKFEHEKLIQYYHIDMNVLKPTLFYFKEAQRFWEQERYKGKELISGKIISVIPNGKAGQILDENGLKYRFSKKFLLNKVKDLHELKGCKVSFYPMKGLGNNMAAEYIRLNEKPDEIKIKRKIDFSKVPKLGRIELPKIKKFESDKLPSHLIGTVIVGSIGAVVEFGVFVKMNGLIDGLLHVNNMPKEMKVNFKEQLKVGNEITVQVKNVSEKGIELKVVE